MRFALVNGQKTQSSSQNRKQVGICPGCGFSVICRAGDIRSPHWQHQNRRDCDTWAESSPWHRRFQADLAEGLNCDLERWMKPHRADAVFDGAPWNTPIIIELQHSPLNATGIEEREQFYNQYGKLIWILNRSNTPIPRLAKSWAAAKSPIFVEVLCLDGPRIFRWSPKIQNLDADELQRQGVKLLSRAQWMFALNSGTLSIDTEVIINSGRVVLAETPKPEPIQIDAPWNELTYQCRVTFENNPYLVMRIKDLQIVLCSPDYRCWFQYPCRFTNNLEPGNPAMPPSETRMWELIQERSYFQWDTVPNPYQEKFGSPQHIADCLAILDYSCKTHQALNRVFGVFSFTMSVIITQDNLILGLTDAQKEFLAYIRNLSSSNVAGEPRS